MSRALVVEHSDTDPPARLGEWLTSAGLTLAVIRPYAGDPVPEAPDGWDAVVVMGGPMGAYDDAAAPWLPATRMLLAGTVAGGVPTLGVCLGAQLLAVACGGRVERGRQGPERGAAFVDIEPAAGIDPLFAGLPAPAGVVQWHDDAVVALPDGGTPLARSDRYLQAFRVGRAAWGVQFHPEVTLPMVELWARRGGVDPADVLPAVRALDLAGTWQPLARRFAALVG